MIHFSICLGENQHGEVNRRSGVSNFKEWPISREDKNRRVVHFKAIVGVFQVPIG